MDGAEQEQNQSERIHHFLLVGTDNSAGEDRKALENLTQDRQKWKKITKRRRQGMMWWEERMAKWSKSDLKPKRTTNKQDEKQGVECL